MIDFCGFFVVKDDADLILISIFRQCLQMQSQRLTCMEKTHHHWHGEWHHWWHNQWCCLNKKCQRKKWLEENYAYRNSAISFSLTVCKTLLQNWVLWWSVNHMLGDMTQTQDKNVAKMIRVICSKRFLVLIN